MKCEHSRKLFTLIPFFQLIPGLCIQAIMGHCHSDARKLPVPSEMDQQVAGQTGHGSLKS
jgi:hypothetical protein